MYRSIRSNIPYSITKIAKSTGVRCRSWYRYHLCISLPLDEGVYIWFHIAGRVTSTVLLHLVDDVVLLEPIESFIKKAISSSSEWKGISDETKSVTFLEGPLQSFDPSQPLHSQSYDFHPHRVGSQNDDGVVGYDVVWCQVSLTPAQGEENVEYWPCDSGH